MRAFNVTNGTLQVDDILTGGGLAKTGAGTMIITNSTSTMNGNTQVLAGALQQNGSNVLSATNLLTVDAGATYSLNGNSQTVAGLGSVAANGGTVALGAGASFAIGGAGTNTFNGVITGTGVTLTKSGAGTQTLSGMSTYSGQTNVNNGILTVAGTGLGTSSVLLNGGTLAGTGTISGDVSAGSGLHTISPGSTSVGALTVGNLYLSSNTILDFSNIVSPSNQDKIISTGSLNATGTATVILNMFSLPAGTFDLIDFASTSLTDATNFAVSGSPQGITLNLTTTSLALTYSPNTWQGADGDNWNTGLHWSFGTSPNAQGAVAYFAPGWGQNVLVDNNQTIGQLVFQGSTSYNIQSGAGTPSLTFDNSGGGGNSQIILQADAAAQTISVPVVLANTDLTVQNNSSNTLTVSGPVSGTGRSLTLTTGTLALSGTGSSYGTTNVNGGTLILSGTGSTVGTTNVSAGAALLVGANGGLPVGGTINVNGGLMDVQSFTATTNTLNLASGTVAGTGGGTLNLATSANFQAGLVSANLGGLGSVTMSGTGLVVLSGTNSYNGPTRISSGTLQAAEGVGMPTTSNLILDGGVWATNGSVNRSLSAGTIQWTANGGGLAAVGGALTMNLDGGNTVVWGSTTNFLPSSVSLVLNSATADNTVNFQNPIDLNGGAHTVVVNNNPGTAADYAILSGAITDGTMYKTGTGLLSLTNAGSNFMMIIQNGTVRASSAVLPNVTWIMNSASTTTGTLESNGTFTNSLGAGAGQVGWASSSNGGFAAQAGQLTVNIGGTGGTLAFGAAGFVSGGNWLVFGSSTADSQVILQNGLNVTTRRSRWCLRYRQSVLQRGLGRDHRPDHRQRRDEHGRHGHPGPGKHQHRRGQQLHRCDERQRRHAAVGRQ